MSSLAGSRRAEEGKQQKRRNRREGAGAEVSRREGAREGIEWWQGNASGKG